MPKWYVAMAVGLLCGATCYFWQWIKLSPDYAVASERFFFMAVGALLCAMNTEDSK